jgi:hypothetical protein
MFGRRADLKTATWTDEAWEKFNRKLFDLSALMQHINGEYAKWFNQQFNRRGHLWADRYKNPELLDLRSLRECLIYIELNALRAGLVKRPEQWRASSAWARQRGQDQDLMSLQSIFPDVPAEEVFEVYRALLYERAELPNSGRSRQDDAQGFVRRMRFFTDGLAIGGKEIVIRRLQELKAQGIYRRRKNPIPQLDGFLYSVREQRSNARH